MALKALNSYAAYLALRNAQDQEEIAAQLALGLFPLWTIMQFRALDDSTVTWLHAAMPLVEKAFRQSQRVQAVYIQNARSALLPTEDLLPITVPDVESPINLSSGAFDMPDPGSADEFLPVYDDFPLQQAAESLTTEANYKTKKQMPGPETDLMQKALVRSSGEAIRQAVDGSRGVTDNIVKRDRKVLGYARVTDSDPCHFCAILASWGGVYKKDSFKASNAKYTSNTKRRGELPEGFTDIAKVHNNCRCTLRPVYTKASDMDAAAKYWLSGWNRIYEQDPYKSNKEMLLDFKAWHEANPYPGTQFDLYALDRDLADRRDALLDAGLSPNSPQVQWAERSRANLAA